MNTTVANFNNTIKNFTTTIGNSHNANGVPVENDNIDMKHILIYALPFSCVMIAIVIIIVIRFHRRNHPFDKWKTLNRMKNTNPCFIESSGLRRESANDSYDASRTNTLMINEYRQESQEDFRLATIT